MKKRLVIFSGSNKLIEDNKLTSNLEKIADNLDVNKFQIWYGGGNTGIMGVIPKKFYYRNGEVFSIDAVQFATKDEEVYGKTFVMETFNERQNKLVEKGDLYLCLPGGIGTLSELFDVLVNNDVNKKDLKIILYSYQNFYKDIINFIEKNIKEGYIRKKIMKNIFVFVDYRHVIDFLNNI